MSTGNGNAVQARPDTTAIEKVLIDGDLKSLTPDQRVSYYKAVCDSVGLNPLTKPFAYLNLSGKLTLYAQKGCTDQLRDIHGISIEKPDIQFAEGLVVVSVTASQQSGRKDSDVGAVPIEGLKGEARANAIMKAITKAKRRTTLSLCGLGMLDETEVETIPDARPVDFEVRQVEPKSLPPAAKPAQQTPVPTRAQTAATLVEVIGKATTEQLVKAAGLMAPGGAKWFDVRDEYRQAVINAAADRKLALRMDVIDGHCVTLGYGAVELAMRASQLNIADIDSMTADDAGRLIAALAADMVGRESKQAVPA